MEQARKPFYNQQRVAQKGSVVLQAWLAQRQGERDVANRVAQHGMQQRSFSGGLPSRLTGSFTPFNTSLDADLYTSLLTLRARSRHLTQNNPYGQKFLRMVASNVVGQGFTLYSRAQDNKSNPDVIDIKSIEQAFTAWSRRGTCDVTGQLSFPELCRLVLRTVAADGEVLIRKVRGKGANKFGYALQVLDIDRLMVNEQRKMPNGNVMRMGVEIDMMGKPVAYWVRQTHPYDPFMQTSAAIEERIPAEDIFHFFIPLRPEQRRGVPWMHAAIERLYHIGELDQSALVAARKGADSLGFIISPDGKPVDPTGSGADEAAIEVSVPGTFDTLPEGYDIKQLESKYPNEVYPVFIKSALRAVASAIGVAYNGLANDLEGVNYSSIRSGVLEEREFWMELQDWFVDAFLERNFEDWLLMALGMGAITGPTGAPLPATKYDKFARHAWQGRRWGWVDPLGDMQANILAMNNGLKSRTRIAAEMGIDREVIWQELAREQQEMLALKLNLSGPPVTNPPITDAPAQDGTSAQIGTSLS
jgi:lambda family phage portal protein